MVFVLAMTNNSKLAMVMIAEEAGSNICSQPYPTSRDWKVQKKVNKKKGNYIRGKEQD